ncbi:MAG: putative quinol monooxygenase [Rhizomicrobium sp.]
MIAVVATIKVRADKVEEFEGVARKLGAQVKANEPDCLLYCMTKDRSDPLTYRNLELFRDQAAIDQHVVRDYFISAVEKMRGCHSEMPTVDFMDTLE